MQRAGKVAVLHELRHLVDIRLSDRTATVFHHAVHYGVFECIASIIASVGQTSASVTYAPPTGMNTAMMNAQMANP